jgi:hypothetical protein
MVALEERLRVIEENDLTDPVLVVEGCLVPNIMVSKEFRVSDFVKYTKRECLNTYL